MADLFKLQDQVVARLANSLGYELVKAEAEKSTQSRNPDAIDLTMRGWALVWQGAQQSMKDKRDSNNAARALFEQALKIDPNDADALAGEAQTYLSRVFIRVDEPPRPITMQKYSVRPIAPSRSPQITFGRIM